MESNLVPAFRDGLRGWDDIGAACNSDDTAVYSEHNVVEDFFPYEPAVDLSHSEPLRLSSLVVAAAVERVHACVREYAHAERAVEL